jgi:hypothetical protein
MTSDIKSGSLSATPSMVKRAVSYHYCGELFEEPGNPLFVLGTLRLDFLGDSRSTQHYTSYGHTLVIMTERRSQPSAITSEAWMGRWMKEDRPVFHPAWVASVRCDARWACVTV